MGRHLDMYDQLRRRLIKGDAIFTREIAARSSQSEGKESSKHSTSLLSFSFCFYNFSRAYYFAKVDFPLLSFSFFFFLPSFFDFLSSFQKFFFRPFFKPVSSSSSQALFASNVVSFPSRVAMRLFGRAIGLPADPEYLSICLLASFQRGSVFKSIL